MKFRIYNTSFLFVRTTRQECKEWVFEDNPPHHHHDNGENTTSNEKIMYAIFFRSTGLVKAIKLEEQKTITANWFTTKYLREILQEINARRLMFVHDNASSQTAELTDEFLKQKQIKVIEHPPYFPNVAMSDFWLFFNLKEKLTWTSFSFRKRD
ncbi:histone-lysine N-methyltransferase SETMAR [Trichonephila clavipes]|nr:histone-lysine N-methyltransferase SETMAR [Trichonephila clavipes]